MSDEAGGGTVEAADIERVDAVMSDWSQGDVATDLTMTWYSNRKSPLTEPSVRGTHKATSDLFAVDKRYARVAVLTQTCDIRKSAAVEPFVQVAPVVDLAGKAGLDNAKGGHSTRFAPLTGLGDTYFADLSMCTTIEKGVLAACDRQKGCADEDGQVAFARATARQRSRYAFPDGFDVVFGPMRDKFRDKWDREASKEGNRLHDVVEIRVFNPAGWAPADHYEIMLHFLIRDSALPPEANQGERGDTTRRFLSKSVTAADVASKLADPDLALGDRYDLWQRLVELWRETCAADPRVTVLSAEAISIAEYTAAQLYREPKLDLDHLSDSSLTPPTTQ